MSTFDIEFDNDEELSRVDIEFDFDIEFDNDKGDSSLGEDNLEPLSTAANDDAPTQGVIEEVLGNEGIYDDPENCPEPGMIGSLRELQTPNQPLIATHDL